MATSQGAVTTAKENAQKSSIISDFKGAAQGAKNGLIMLGGTLLVVAPITAGMLAMFGCAVAAQTIDIAAKPTMGDWSIVPAVAAGIGLGIGNAISTYVATKRVWNKVKGWGG